MLLLLACIGVITSTAQVTEQVQHTLEEYRYCLMNSNKKRIKEIVDESFRIGVYQQPYASNLFASFLDHIEAPDSVSWDSVQNTKEDIVCMVNYHFRDTIISSTVTFSVKGKLLYSDWLDQKGFNFWRKRPSVYVTSIPFKLINGKMFIKARLNNTEEPLNMIFDTGADGMALRADLKDKCDVKISRSHTANMPGGGMQVNLSEGNALVLDSITISQQNLVLFKYLGKGVDGIIGGSNLFRYYITEVDFDEQLIRLYKHGQFIPPLNYTANNMLYANGVPTVPFSIYKEGHVFETEFIFDTGAGYEAILFGNGVKELERDSITKVIHPLYYSYNASLGHRTKTMIGKADSIYFSNMCFKNTLLAMEEYNPANHGRLNVKGSIGINTLCRFNWIIDLTSYKVHSKVNTLGELPMNFTMDSFLIGYRGTNLVVLSKVSSEVQPNGHLKVGDRIMAIDDVLAINLTETKLKRLLKKSEVTLKVMHRQEREEKIVVLNLN